MSRQRVAVLGLGANLGPAEDTLRWAVEALASVLDGLQVAPLYRTPAASPIAQPDYLNTVVAGRTDLPADALLALGKRLELLAGRRPGPRWGPRPLDIDLLVVGDTIMSRPELTLPHPRLEERPFVLAPLVDLLPALVLPGSGRTAASALEALPEVSSLSRLPWRRPPALSPPRHSHP